MSQQFYTLLTSVGKAKIAAANAAGTKVNLSTLKVGDGNGNYYEPTEAQVDLVHTVWQGNIGSIKIDDNNSNWIIIDTVIPSDAGGFTIREAGIFDDSGNLLAIAKYPETYKPAVEDGAIKDLTIEIIVEISNTANVTLKVNPNITLATQKDISGLDNKIKALSESTNETVKKNAEDIEALEGKVSSQLADNTKHITSAERTAWNNKVDSTNYQRSGGYAVTSGTSTAYTITLNPAPTAYSDGMQIIIIPHVDSGATPTLNVNGLGALTIVKQDGSAIATGDIKANKPLSIVRVGSYFFIRNSGGYTVGQVIPTSNLVQLTANTQINKTNYNNLDSVIYDMAFDGTYFYSFTPTSTQFTIKKYILDTLGRLKLIASAVFTATTLGISSIGTNYSGLIATDANYVYIGLGEPGYFVRLNNALDGSFKIVNWGDKNFSNMGYSYFCKLVGSILYCLISDTQLVKINFDTQLIISSQTVSAGYNIVAVIISDDGKTIMTFPWNGGAIYRGTNIPDIGTITLIDVSANYAPYMSQLGYPGLALIGNYIILTENSYTSNLLHVINLATGTYVANYTIPTRLNSNNSYTPLTLVANTQGSKDTSIGVICEYNIYNSTGSNFHTCVTFDFNNGIITNIQKPTMSYISATNRTTLPYLYFNKNYKSIDVFLLSSSASSNPSYSKVSGYYIDK